ncbi:DMT family transporter [Streptomyces sp. DH37]|uniref:DMT family transporter n=1 Tax=Streptomyces sp. DH37 TaxID=3040122 RepID=UPI0024413A02|nr:DMT family transporter [Streptomyces sp. DH37]MDG9701250.1 DMT family transporter [Streptomyces sp. DH37]
MRAVHVKMTVATVLLGSYLVASKLILREVPVFTATFVRLVSAAALLALYVRLRGRGPAVRPGRRDGAVLFAQTFLGVFLFSVFAMYGVKFTGAIEAGVILGMVPISISLVALLFLGERLSSRRGTGIVLAVVGAVSINVMSSQSSEGAAGSHVALGALLLVCSVLCEAVFVTFGKLLSTPIPPARLSLILSVAGALMFLVPAGIESGWGAGLAQVSWQTWALMIYTGVAINGVAVVLMYDSLDSVDTTVVAAFTAVTPVSGTVLSVLLLHEEFRLHHLLGMALVIAGVFVVAREKNSGDGGEVAGSGKGSGDAEIDGINPVTSRSAVT